MKKEYKFIEETSNQEKIKIFIITFFVLTVIGAFVLSSFTIFKDAISSSAPFRTIQSYFIQDLKNFTSLGLLYWSFAASLFFLPSPVEFFFYLGLKKGNLIIFSLFMVIAGTLLAHAVDYYLGKKFSPFLMNFISVKKVYQVRRWFDRYGTPVIFIISLIPALPSDILAFGLGIAKSNPTRLFTMLFLGNLVKFLAIVGFFLLYR